MSILELTHSVGSRQSDVVITVVIPTFDRKDNIHKLLRFLSTITPREVQIYVVDNLSSVDLELESIDSYNFSCHVKVFKNKFHLGPDASVIRALELCDSSWVYLLGDSKIPVADVFNLMLSDCSKYDDHHGIVYSFDQSIDKSLSISSIKDIPIKYGDFFLGGNSLISKRSLEQYLYIASQLTVTRMAHSIFHIMPLCKGDKIRLSSDRVMKEFVSKPSGYNPGLSLLECWAQFALITLLPIDASSQKLINKMILENENSESRIVFLKFTLLSIFRYRQDIRYHMKKIIAYRYVYARFSLEKWFLIYPLYILSLVVNPFLARSVNN